MPKECEKLIPKEAAECAATPCCAERTRDGVEQRLTHRTLPSPPELPSSWFDFGRNWVEFSRRAITREKAQQAREEFRQLLAGIDLREKWFLDIGFGQGLSLLAAAESGARAVGCDINARCLEALQASSVHFPALRTEAIDVVVGSILEPAVAEQLRAKTPGALGYHVVHSWGVLHHTGDLWSALAVAGALVRTGGHLVVAIYNRHITSPAWVWIKRFYNTSPRWVRRGMILFFYPVILLSKRIVTGKNPLLQERGMDFYYNVVDWIGGYPYESAVPEELIRHAASLGFTCVRSRPAGVPTGCNEFVFKRA